MRTSTFLALASAFLLTGACRENSPQPLAPSFASTSSLPHINITELPLPVSVDAELTATNCSNNPGPTITLDGVAALGGFGVEMSFSNNLKGTHDTTFDKQVDLALQPAGQSITIPKQPVLGGVGGNPFMWVQFVNAAGTPTSDEIYLGRCVQGSRYGFTHAEVTTGSAFAEFGITGCQNSPGPFISIGASLAYEGLGAQVIFRNNDNPVGGPHEATRSQTLSLIPPGLSFTFPKQGVQGGVGGNPWIYAGFLDGGGARLDDPTLLGRCVQISKALS
ncbi:MAG TPA: hypothetical protein VEK83_00335 [Gemmatimonadales bacterium]|nr:hypothetical protein [Gemmatimonadales bacterium]